MTTVHRWALLSLAPDYLALGWLPHPATFAGTLHGLYRLHVEWRCRCGRAPPKPLSAKTAR